MKQLHVHLQLFKDKTHYSKKLICSDKKIKEKKTKLKEIIL